MGCCHLEAFHFKTGTVLGKLGQAGLILAPLCSLHVELAELLLSRKVPVVRGLENLYVSFAATSQRSLFYGSVVDTPTCLPLVLDGSHSQGAHSGPCAGWFLYITLLSPPARLQMGELGPREAEGLVPGDTALQ